MYSANVPPEKTNFEAYVKNVSERFNSKDGEVTHVKQGNFFSRGIRSIRGKEQKQDSDLRIVLTTLGMELKAVMQTADASQNMSDGQRIKQAHKRLLSSVQSVTNYTSLSNDEKQMIEDIIQLPEQIWGLKAQEGQARIKGAQLRRPDPTSGAYQDGAAAKVKELKRRSSEIGDSDSQSEASELSHVDLSGYRDVDLEVLQELPELPELRSINLSRVPLNALALDGLKGLWYRQDFELLDLSNSPGLRDADIKRLSIQFVDDGCLNLAGCTLLGSKTAENLAELVEQNELQCVEKGQRFSIIVPMLLPEDAPESTQEIKALVASYQEAFKELGDRVQLKFLERISQKPSEAIDLDAPYLPDWLS